MTKIIIRRSLLTFFAITFAVCALADAPFSAILVAIQAGLVWEAMS
jgi:uncharacterized protein (DUF697 family)